MAEEERTYSVDRDDIFDMALRAIENCRRLRVRDYDENEGVINALTGVSALSWGENVLIEVVPESRGTRVRVCCNTKLFTNILHGGVVEENIRDFFDNLEREM